MKRTVVLAAAVLSLCSSGFASAALILLPGGTFSVPSTNTGSSFTFTGTLTGNDQLGFTETGLACLQSGGTYCTNGAGVVVTAGTTGVGGSSANGGTTFGALLLTISGVGTQQLFPTNAANGLGSASPPSLLLLAPTALSSFGFGAFSQVNPTLTFAVSDTIRDDNSGGFTLTQAPVAVRVPEPASLALLGIALAAFGMTRKRKKT